MKITLDGNDMMTALVVLLIIFAVWYVLRRPVNGRPITRRKPPTQSDKMEAPEPWPMPREYLEQGCTHTPNPGVAEWPDGTPVYTGLASLPTKYAILEMLYSVGDVRWCFGARSLGMKEETVIPRHFDSEQEALKYIDEHRDILMGQFLIVVPIIYVP